MLTVARKGLTQPYHSIDTLNSGPRTGAMIGLTGATAWGTANRAIYVPVAVDRRVVVRKLWFASGNVGTGNYDLGLYDSAGTRLLARGSTAKPAAATEEVWDCTDTTIGPGLYYMALNNDTTTDTFHIDSHAAPNWAGCGVLEEALGSVALPATASWSLAQTLTLYPIMGMLLVTEVS